MTRFLANGVSLGSGALPNAPKSDIRAAAAIVIVRENIFAQQRQIDVAGIIFDMQVVTGWVRFCGKFACVHIISEAMPIGLTLET